MSAPFRCLVLALCLSAGPAAAETPSWDDPAWYAAPPNPLNLTMTPDMDRGVASVIGPKGGTFRTTGATGDVYALTIPEGALFTDTRIALIPVAEARGLPEGAGPFSGVILQPDGLELAETGWLEITPATPIPPENRALWGFYGMGEDARGEIPWPGTGDRIVIPIDHFSGAGVSFADRVNLQLDRWRQRLLEDRVRSQLAEMIRESAAGVTRDGEAFSDAFGRDATRVLQHGWRMIASRPAASCDDLKGVIAAALALERQGQLLGVSAEDSVRLDLQSALERSWAVCFPEEVQLCLRTGDLRVLVEFALTFERQRQLLGFGEDAADPNGARRQADLRAALERCGRFELEVTSQGSYQSDGGGDGTYSFSARIPLRLTFDEPNGFTYRIEGEGPATDVSVTPINLSEFVIYRGHRVTTPVSARITRYEFTHDDSHRPLRLEVLITPPIIFADFTTTYPKLDIPVSLAGWYLTYKDDLAADAFKLTRFQARRHPVLFEMDWTGQGNDGDLVMTDSTRFRLIHIAQ